MNISSFYVDYRAFTNTYEVISHQIRDDSVDIFSGGYCVLLFFLLFFLVGLASLEWRNLDTKNMMCVE